MVEIKHLLYISLVFESRGIPEAPLGDSLWRQRQVTRPAKVGPKQCCSGGQLGTGPG